MRYYKILSGNYIVCIGIGSGGEKITDAEYNELFSAIRNKPTPPEGYGYRLKNDLTWELYELPAVEDDTDPELTDTEALEIILGGAV